MLLSRPHNYPNPAEHILRSVVSKLVSLLRMDESWTRKFISSLFLSTFSFIWRTKRFIQVCEGTENIVFSLDLVSHGLGRLLVCFPRTAIPYSCLRSLSINWWLVRSDHAQAGRSVQTPLRHWRWNI